MKTIDILVEELPKRGGWPYGAIGAGFLSGEGSIYFWDEKNDCHSKWTIDIDIDIEVEDSDEGITREQYEAALAAKKEGCIEWGGGECPVPEGALVDVRYRNSEEFPDTFCTVALAVGGYGATGRHWNHDGYPNDIIAYRLHQPQEEAQSKAGDESGLNECIEQDAAPVWNGAGLPPVGCECRVDYGSVELTDGLSRPDDGDVVRVVSHEKTGFGTQVVVVYWNGVNGCGRAHALIPKCLRPLRTETERKRDIAAGEIFDVICKSLTDESESMSFSIYDAIAAGKVPGVKLED